MGDTVKLIKTILLTVSCLLFLHVKVFGAPTITGVVQDTQNNTITISGSDFGNGPNVILFDDFEGGTDGQRISTGEGSAVKGEWNAYDATGSEYYSNNYHVSGSLSFSSDYSIHYCNWIETLLPSETREIFIYWWLYVPSTSNLPGEGSEDGVNWKQMWVQGSSTADDDLVVPTCFGLTSWEINGNDQDPGYTAWVTVNFSKGLWKNLFCYLKGSTTSTSEDGVVQLWEVNTGGVNTVLNDTSANNLKETGEWERVRPNGWGRQTSNCETYFDDIYVAAGANAKARVVLGNSSVYSNCSVLSIQLPTTWSDTSIECRINNGMFNNEDIVYLFVIDSNDNVSNGYPITLGASSKSKHFCSGQANFR